MLRGSRIVLMGIVALAALFILGHIVCPRERSQDFVCWSIFLLGKAVSATDNPVAV